MFNKISRIGAAVLASLALFACKEDNLVKPSALISESSLTFDAVGAEPQTFTVASDAEWMLDVNADWITLGQMSGRNTEEVTVTVADNKDSKGNVGAPRQATITIMNKREYTVTTVIYQKGDSYYGVDNMTFDAVADLEDGKFAKVSGVQILAAGAEGFVAKDSKATVYCTYGADVEPVAVGSTVNLGGEKSTLYGLASLKAGQIEVLSEGAEVTHPTPVDLAAGISAGAGKSVAYVSTYAGLLGRVLNYETPLPGDATATLLDPDSSIDLDGVNMHNIDIEAYYVGADKGDIKLLVTKVEDKGINENLNAYFYDDFSWMKPLIDASGVKVGDSVGENNASADAPNLRSNTGLGQLLEEFEARGYADLNQEAKVIYPQAYYWKFGKTSNHGGLKLPSMEFEGAEQINVFLDFDWAAHMTGSGNVDKVQIVAEIVEGPGLFDNGTSVCDPLYTTQEKGHIEWQHAHLEIKGVNNETRIVLRPDKFAEADPDQQRWHLDNIKIKNTGVPYSDPVYANVSLSDEVITFEGAPEGPATLKITSDNPWTITAAPGNDWFSFDITEGAANEEVAVTVTCQPSTSVNLRHGYVTLSSADTRKNIHIVQSAAGGELDPLIAVVGTNSITVLGEGESFTVSVQSNVEYAVDIQDEWISEVPGLSTMAIVEKKSHSFTAATNLTGAPRTGHIRFYNDDGIESVLTVQQENFEPRIDMSIAGSPAYLFAESVDLSVTINANISFTVTSNVIELPVKEAVAGTYDLKLTVPANTGSGRYISVTFTNDEYSYSKTYSIRQFGTDLIFLENFEWLDQWAVSTENEAGRTVETDDLSAYAPQLPTPKVNEVSALQALLDKGYVFTRWNKGVLTTSECIYLQRNYLKVGKTGYHAAIQLPAMSSASVATIYFDWCPMRQGSGKLDPVHLLVQVENGEDTATFEVPTHGWEDGHKLEWIHSRVPLTGVSIDENTRITIRQIDAENAAGTANRWFIDNIIVEAE